ncbi:type II toxin-antitoxin system RelE/ParE family toxin [Anaerocellum danielii]|uniref:Type II toxin-antitoxin system RelE/ParE family toxin n=1 Tax=Anaerocellum danielii TaxID=1387557 RepID=A0ABZ0TXR5_9FIRM|nr:type II toxin-antitoxin system RelE/ParE family toxin [Caldicellulosiruptor danielii]WPX08244.1 type II toxin-antitoxin system RelE/ParE family toxin [Caldicellulosiruptor danielii]
MEVRYKTKKLQKICENYKLAQKEFGQDIAKKLFQRLNELKAAKSLYDISCLPATGFHKLEGSRKGQYAVYLVHPFRLVFTSISPSENQTQNDIDLTKIIIIQIEEVIDYHGKEKR